MSHQNIFSEDTNKLKTKLYISSGLSLFVGLTKTLPTKFSIIGLNFEYNKKILGWFLFSITIFLFVHFTIIASLNVIKYFKDYFINRKSKTLTGDIIGLTYKEIGEDYSRQDQYIDTEPKGSLSNEVQDIHRKIKSLEEKFDKKHLNYYNLTEIIFNYATPIVLAIISIGYLYCFLSKC